MAEQEGTGLERVESEQVINSQATRNVLEKELVRWAKRTDTSPSVLNVHKLMFRNTVATLVIRLDDGAEGQTVDVLGDGFTTIQNNTKIITASGADTLLAAGAVYTFTRWPDGKWHEHASSGGGGGGGGGSYVPLSHLTDADPHPQYVLDSEKGAVSGVATLDGSGKVPLSQLPTGIGTTFTRWDVDKPPASAHAKDAEFVGGAVAWPAAYVDMTAPFSVQSFTESPNTLEIRATSTNWKGKAIAVPAAGVDFQIAMKARVHGPGANYVLGALTPCVDLNPVAAQYATQAFFGYHTAHGGSWCVTTEVSGGAPSFGDWGFQPIACGNSIVLRWRRVGTDWFFDWSLDGRSWIGTLTGAALAVNYIQIAYLSAHGQYASCMEIDWVRWLDTGAAANFGGLRTISGS
jgi:hypothetical protein